MVSQRSVIDAGGQRVTVPSGLEAGETATQETPSGTVEIKQLKSGRTAVTVIKDGRRTTTIVDPGTPVTIDGGRPRVRSRRGGGGDAPITQASGSTLAEQALQQSLPESERQRPLDEVGLPPGATRTEASLGQSLPEDLRRQTPEQARQQLIRSRDIARRQAIEQRFAEARPAPSPTLEQRARAPFERRQVQIARGGAPLRTQAEAGLLGVGLFAASPVLSLATAGQSFLRQPGATVSGIGSAARDPRAFGAAISEQAKVEGSQIRTGDPSLGTDIIGLGGVVRGPGLVGKALRAVQVRRAQRSFGVAARTTTVTERGLGGVQERFRDVSTIEGGIRAGAEDIRIVGTARRIGKALPDGRARFVETTGVAAITKQGDVIGGAGRQAVGVSAPGIVARVGTETRQVFGGRVNLGKPAAFGAAPTTARTTFFSGIERVRQVTPDITETAAVTARTAGSRIGARPVTAVGTITKTQAAIGFGGRVAEARTGVIVGGAGRRGAQALAGTRRAITEAPSTVKQLATQRRAQIAIGVQRQRERLVPGARPGLESELAAAGKGLAGDIARARFKPPVSRLGVAGASGLAVAPSVGAGTSGQVLGTGQVLQAAEIPTAISRTVGVKPPGVPTTPVPPLARSTGRIRFGFAPQLATAPSGIFDRPDIPIGPTIFGRGPIGGGPPGVPAPPVFLPFGGDPDVIGGPTRGKRQRRFRFTPSLTAILFGIVGKAPKKGTKFTGFELRPLPSANIIRSSALKIPRRRGIISTPRRDQLLPSSVGPKVKRRERRRVSLEAGPIVPASVAIRSRTRRR